jgi:hypothetical protein
MTAVTAVANQVDRRIMRERTHGGKSFRWRRQAFRNPRRRNDRPTDAGIERLFDSLRNWIEANRLFQAGMNDGREGAIHSVESVLKFLRQIPQIGDQGLTAPLARLFDALMNLDDGSPKRY